MANNHAGDKSDNGLIIGVVLLLVGPLLAWYLLRKPVVFFWSWINYGQIWMLAHVQGLVGQHPVAEHMAANQPLLNWLLWAHIHDGKITWHQVTAISTEVGSYYRWVFVPLILLLAGINYMAVEKRQNRYGVDDTVVAMKDLFPWGLPWLWQKSEVLSSSKAPAFAYAARPWDFCRDLAQAPEGEPDHVYLTDPDALRAKLESQLKNPVGRNADWPVWFQALSSALVPQARDGKDGETLERLRILARHYYGVKLKKGGAYTPPELKSVPWPVKERDTVFMDAIAARHGYRDTAFLDLLKQARNKGMAAPAYMAWLRAVDRTLWYAVQSLDRPRAFVEGHGVLAHYQEEMKSGEAIYDPCVEDAVVGMIAALREEDGSRRVAPEDEKPWENDL
ncbi:secretion/conjugation apparatus DotM-related subunit [Acidithiobacillus sp.]